jgi:hypothetical protein
MGVKGFKLITGDEIMGDVTNETGEYVQLKNPVALAMAREGLALIPWLPIADRPECVINTRNIIVSYVPQKELINHYKQQTGGIVTAGVGALNQLPPNFGR